MELDPYEIPKPEQVQKEHNRALGTLAKMIEHSPTVLKGILGLGKYALKHGISNDQALTEAIMALPKQPYLPHEQYLNLSTWVKVCELADIPHIPVTLGPSVKVDILEKTTEDIERAAINKTQLPIPDISVQKAAKWCEEQYNLGRIWRWECCGSNRLKLVAGTRKIENIKNPNLVEIPNTLPHIPFQLDQRLFHILWESQATEIGLVSRPWVPAEIYNGFPVEFRVFHYKDKESAACNYYPQRDLSPEYAPYMEQAVKLTERLAKFVPDTVSELTPVPQDFSCDWLLTPNKEVVFLESGPLCTLQGGAHPCCFALPTMSNLKQGLGPLPGRRLFGSEPGADLYIDPARQAVINEYKGGAMSLLAASKKAKINPDHFAAILAMQGIIPHEAYEKLALPKS